MYLNYHSPCDSDALVLPLVLSVISRNADHDDVLYLWTIILFDRIIERLYSLLEQGLCTSSVEEGGRGSLRVASKHDNLHQ